MKRKLIAIALALAMLLQFAACGKNDDTGKADNTYSEAEAAETADTPDTIDKASSAAASAASLVSSSKASSNTSSRSSSSASSSSKSNKNSSAVSSKSKTTSASSQSSSKQSASPTTVTTVTDGGQNNGGTNNPVNTTTEIPVENNAQPIQPEQEEPVTSSDWKYNEAREIAQRFADSITGNTDVERVSKAASIVSIICSNCCVYTTEDPDYPTAYGVFVKGVYTCAGSTRALGMVLECMGYSWTHVNENEWTHQWCEVVMDDNLGWADGQLGQAGYGDWGENSQLYTLDTASGELLRDLYNIPMVDSPYARPFDIAAIRNEMITYGEQKGLILDESISINNASSFSIDTRYSQDKDYESLHRSCLEEIDSLINMIKYDGLSPSDIHFNVQIVEIPEHPGEYKIYLVYG